jgi:hypothetical protein
VLTINYLEVHMATSKKSNEQTSASVASKASKQLSNPKSTPAQRSVAASAVTQAPNKAKAKK